MSICLYCGINFEPKKMNQKFCCESHHAGTIAIDKTTKKVSSLSKYKQEHPNQKTCAICGYDVYAILQVHHINCNRQDNREENLQLLCPNCHTKKHYDERTTDITFYTARLADLLSEREKIRGEVNAKTE